MRLLRVGFACLLCAAVLALPGAAFAARRAPAPGGDDKDKPPFKAAILIEADSGQVLEEQNADEKLVPASIVKMMVMLLVTEAVEKGVHKLDEAVITSAAASKIGGSQVYLKQGEKFSLGELLKTVSVASSRRTIPPTRSPSTSRAPPRPSSSS
ncbi:MAG: serine hydrolase [Candidatus Tectomicrobia bacterium]|nr:serine hydrolase [Candidatus Tectomicrobia bacterium]